MAKGNHRSQSAPPATPAGDGGATATLETFEGIDPRTIAPPGAIPSAPAPSAELPPAPASTPAPTPSVDPTSSVMVEVPFLHIEKGYVSRSFGRRSLTHAQAQTLRDVADALHADGASLESGRKVVDGDDAVAWLMERIAESRLARA